MVEPPCICCGVSTLPGLPLVGLHPPMNFYFPMQTCQVDTEDACLQICLTNKYLPEDRQGTSACQDSGEDLKKTKCSRWSRSTSAADYALCCDLNGKQWIIVVTLPTKALWGCLCCRLASVLPSNQPASINWRMAHSRRKAMDVR